MRCVSRLSPVPGRHCPARGAQSLIDHVDAHQIYFTVKNQYSQLGSRPKSSRHVQEKTKLLDRLRRDRGTWSSNHPRHRLLDALHGYSRYYQRQDEELKRLKGLYSKVSKKQRTVSCPLSVSEHPMADAGMVYPSSNWNSLYTTPTSSPRSRNSSKATKSSVIALLEMR